MGVNEGSYRLLPVRTASLDEGRLPLRISMLASLDLADPASAKRNVQRLLDSLGGSLPHR